MSDAIRDESIAGVSLEGVVTRLPAVTVTMTDRGDTLTYWWVKDADDLRRKADATDDPDERHLLNLIDLVYQRVQELDCIGILRIELNFIDLSPLTTDKGQP